MIVKMMTKFLLHVIVTCINHVTVLSIVCDVACINHVTALSTVQCKNDHVSCIGDILTVTLTLIAMLILMIRVLMSRFEMICMNLILSLRMVLQSL